MTLLFTNLHSNCQQSVTKTQLSYNFEQHRETELQWTANGRLLLAVPFLPEATWAHGFILCVWDNVSEARVSVCNSWYLCWCVETMWVLAVMHVMSSHMDAAGAWCRLNIETGKNTSQTLFTHITWVDGRTSARCCTGSNDLSWMASRGQYAMAATSIRWQYVQFVFLHFSCFSCDSY